MESGSHCVNQVDCSAPNNMAGVEALLQASIPRFPLLHPMITFISATLNPRAIARGWNPGNVFGSLKV